MSYRNICINGDFLCRNLTGIERFALEICTKLDKIIQKDSLCMYIPANAKFIPEFQNIKILKSDVECTVFPLWEHIAFKKFLKKNKFNNYKIRSRFPPKDSPSHRQTFSTNYSKFKFNIPKISFVIKIFVFLLQI